MHPQILEKQRKWPILVTVTIVTRRNVALVKIECRAMGTPHARRSMKNFPITFAAKKKKESKKAQYIKSALHPGPWRALLFFLIQILIVIQHG